MLDLSGDLALVYQESGTAASVNGAVVFGFYDSVSLDVLAENGQGMISITKKTFRIITGSIPNLTVNQTSITFGGTTYKIIGANAIGDGLETDLVLQA
jgi:capsule polysaccharide modification protein KpsS